MRRATCLRPTRDQLPTPRSELVRIASLIAGRIEPRSPEGSSRARLDYDQALHHELRARATELAAAGPGDAVEAALLAALGTATAEGWWGDVAQLASELEGRRRAKAATVPARCQALSRPELGRPS